ncbi:MAG: hypothetical protein QM296_11040 [Bacillota bacterium]|nr:hypothetical protein [Bacillota bacterium]
MTKAILDAPIKVFATQNVIDSCWDSLEGIHEELVRLDDYDKLDGVKQTELKMIMEIIGAALGKE